MISATPISRPEVILCKPDVTRTEIRELKTVYDFIEKPRLNEISELNFKIPKYRGNKETNLDYTLIKDKYLVKFNNVYYQIQNPIFDDDNINANIQIVAYSQECELRNKNIFSFTGTFKLYDSMSPSESLMTQLVAYVPSWSVGTIDDDIETKWRTFDIANKNLYEFLKNDVQKSYNCVVYFDTVNKNINLKKVTSIGENKGLYLSEKNLIEKYQKQILSDEVVTRLYVYGADGISIRSVNPLGKDYIQSFDYYKNTDYISQGLIDALDAYEEMLEGTGTQYTGTAQAGGSNTITLASGASSTDDFYNGMEIFLTDGTGKGEFRVITDYVGSTKVVTVGDAWDNTPNSTSVYLIQTHISKSTIFQQYLTDLDTLYSSLSTKQSELATLESQFNVIQNAINVKIKASQDYSTEYSQLVAKQSEIDSKNGEIDDVSDQITNIEVTQIGYLDDYTDEASNFTTAQLSELDYYIIDNTFQDETFVITDEMTYAQQMEVYQDLYDRGVEILNNVSEPVFEFSIDSADFLKDFRFTNHAAKLVIGDLINIGYKDEVIVETRLLGYDHDWDNNKLDLIFCNRIKPTDPFKAQEELLNTAISVGNTVSFERYKYNKYVNSGERSRLSEFITSALNATTNRIISNDDQEVTIDQFGITCKESDGAGGYLSEQLKILNNVIAFSDDGFETSNLALGKIPNPVDGTEYVYGLIAQVLVGKITISENLLIDNSSGTFEVNSDGVTITDLDLTITRSDGKSAILLNTTDGIKIQGDLDGLGLTDNFYVGIDGRIKAKGIDIDGTGTFSGSLSAATGTFSGTVSAGTIESSVFVSGILKTADTGARIEIDANGLISYDDEDQKEGICIETGDWGYSALNFYQNDVKVGSLEYNSLGVFSIGAAGGAQFWIHDALILGQMVFSSGIDNATDPDRERGYLFEDAEGLHLKHINSDGTILDILSGDDGIIQTGNTGAQGLRNIHINNTEPTSPQDNDLWIDTDVDFVDLKMRRIDSVNINKSLGEVTVLMEGEAVPETIDYTEDATSMTFTWADGHTATVSIS